MKKSKTIGIIGAILIAILSLIPWDHQSLAAEDINPSDFTENKERNRREGILYTIEDTNKITLTSGNGEICVRIPRWKGFSAGWERLSATQEICQMSNINHDAMEYSLIASWDQEDADTVIAADFEPHYNRDNVLGDVYHMTVNGINICYRPCYEFIHSRTIDWHYVIWADLGCGQFLKTELTQGLQSDEATSRAYDYEVVPPEVTEPLNIEGVIEALYQNIEVCTAEGDSLPISYQGPPSAHNVEPYYQFSFGIVREYKTDAYRKSSVCTELIEDLYQAVKTGSIEEMLQQEAVADKKLSIAEKLNYIKKEETGMLLAFDARYTQIRQDSFPPTQFELIKGADTTKEFLVYSGHDYFNDVCNYIWFPCEKSSDNHILAQKGLYVYGSDTREHYFLFSQGNPYLCIVNRDAEETIESVVLYDFATPDLIGTLIYIDASSVRLCSFVRNEGGYGTEMPWYLFDNRIDTGPVFFSMLNTWKITEFLGETDALHIENIGPAAYAKEQKRTQTLTDTYLGQELNMSWNRKKHDVSVYHSASIYGYYYNSTNNLYKVYRQPGTLAMEAPISAARIKVNAFDEAMDILMDRNGKAAICVEGRFFLLEKSEESPKELRTWE